MDSYCVYMIRVVLAIPELMDNDSGQMFRLELTICSQLIATMATCSASVSHSVAYG